MTAQVLILSKIRTKHVGREKAVKRKDLLDWLLFRGAIEKITESEDREVRAIIEQHPEILSCELGYYVAKKGEEGFEDVEYSIKYIQKKAIPLLTKIRRKKEAYPEYYRGEQMELF